MKIRELEKLALKRFKESYYDKKRLGQPTHIIDQNEKMVRNGDMIWFRRKNSYSGIGYVGIVFTHTDILSGLSDVSVWGVDEENGHRRCAYLTDARFYKNAGGWEIKIIKKMEELDL